MITNLQGELPQTAARIAGIDFTDEQLYTACVRALDSQSWRALDYDNRANEV
jgi:hypothetical protein